MGQRRPTRTGPAPASPKRVPATAYEPENLTGQFGGNLGSVPDRRAMRALVRKELHFLIKQQHDKFVKSIERRQHLCLTQHDVPGLSGKAERITHDRFARLVEKGVTPAMCERWRT